ncbi:MAG: hypothetical protein M1831_004209 [Alyxoria varia]|nr:MAG: hypothetical protein M1831_004209 [Alyxoria varia]
MPDAPLQQPMMWDDRTRLLQHPPPPPSQEIADYFKEKLIHWIAESCPPNNRDQTDSRMWTMNDYTLVAAWMQYDPRYLPYPWHRYPGNVPPLHTPVEYNVGDLMGYTHPVLYQWLGRRLSPYRLDHGPHGAVIQSETNTLLWYRIWYRLEEDAPIQNYHDESDPDSELDASAERRYYSRIETPELQQGPAIMEGRGGSRTDQERTSSPQ